MHTASAEGAEHTYIEAYARSARRRRVVCGALVRAMVRADEGHPGDYRWA